MNTRNDRDLEDLLGDDAGRIGAAYRKLGKVDLPRRLDRNVLAEASRAVHGRPRASRWLLGVGTAAGVLLAGGIAWRVNHDMLQQRESVPMSSPAAEAAPSGVIRVEPREKVSDHPVLSEEPAPTKYSLDAAEAETSSTAAVEGNSQVEREAAQAKQKLDNTFVRDPEIKKSAPKPAKVAAERREEVREQAAPESPPSPAPPVVAAPMQTPVSDESNVAKDIRDDAEAESAMASEPMQKAEGAGRSATTRSSISSRDDVRREGSSSFGNAAVTAEIDRIRVLLRAGEHDSALKALRELRLQHPDVVLPADLRALDG